MLNYMFFFSEKCTIVFENYNGDYEFHYLFIVIQVKNLPRRCHCYQYRLSPFL